MNWLKKLFPPAPVPVDCEYWIFGKDQAVPPTADLMRLSVHEPLEGRSKLGKNEGLVFSDIRFDIALATREKNKAVFRPDLFDYMVQPSEDILAALGRCNTFIRIRFYSKEPVEHHAHCILLPRLAEVVAKLTSAEVVLDQITRQIWSVADFSKHLDQHPDLDRPEFHVRLVWESEPPAQVLRTLGLGKVGAREFVSSPLDVDQTVLAEGCWDIGILFVWKVMKPPMGRTIDFELYGDHYRLEFAEIVNGAQLVKIMKGIRID